MKTERLPELKAELEQPHPITGAYSADIYAAALEVMAQNIPSDKSNMTGSEIFLQTDPTEYAALTDQKKLEWLNFCGIDNHDPVTGGLAHQFVDYVFGPASTTLSNLAAFRSILITRAAQLGWGIIHPGDVENARNLP